MVASNHEQRPTDVRVVLDALIGLPGGDRLADMLRCCEVTCMDSDKPDPTKSRVPGEWYIVATCKACQQDNVLAHDKDAKVASGAVRLGIQDDGQVNVKCSTCGQTQSYGRDEIKSIQAE